MPATIDLEACARVLENEAYRLVGVTKQHRDKLVREKADPDPRLQRGNASAFSHTEGVVCGIALALRKFGFEDRADQVEHALNNYSVTNDEIAELEQEVGFEEWSR